MSDRRTKRDLEDENEQLRSALEDMYERASDLLGYDEDDDDDDEDAAA